MARTGHVHVTITGDARRLTNTYGGRTDHRAVIGHAPEDRTWKPGVPTFRPYIAHTARVEAFATIDAGLKRATYVGPRSWIFKHAHLGHDAMVGADVEVCTGAVIGGHAIIGDGAKIGINATILPHINIGSGARIGAGAVVTKNVPPGETWVGNPARNIDAEQKAFAAALSSFIGKNIGK